MSMTQRYKERGIWTMESGRDTCIVPETPLLISRDEERILNELARAVWRALETAVEWGFESIGPTGKGISDRACAFPDGPTLPPAVRIDTIRTGEGPKIVEVDPISAISIGETLSLQRLWSEEGYIVPVGLKEAIVSEIKRRSNELAVDIPSGKMMYKRDLDYLINEVKDEGVKVNADAIRTSDTLQLSAFNDIAATRRAINRDGWQFTANPLWGSLVGIADKQNLNVLIGTDKLVLPKYLPKTYSRNELKLLDSRTRVVAKPLMGTGSNNVEAISVSEAISIPDDYIFQELLTPLTDDFGEINTIKQESRTQWVSRVSVYAGRYGLLGAQVTARPREQQSDFTNVHGQSDAIQTTLAVI